MSGRSKSKINQSSKSISSLPHREFPVATNTFSRLAVLILIAIFSIFLDTSNTFAESSISISLSGSVDLYLMGGDLDGVFGMSSSAYAYVKTNNYTGYTFTIRGNNPSGDLVGNNDQNHIIPSIQVSNPITAQTFSDPANTQYNNKWGFRPSHLSTSTGTITNNGYISAPTNTNVIEIDKTSSANEGDSNEYTLAVAARVNDQTPNDHYSGTFTLAATGNATPYHIAYTDDVQNMPSMTIGETTGASINISSQTPYKNGYIFLGWCSVPTSNNTCSGDTYQPGGSYTLDPTADNSITLHAIWGTGYSTFDAAFAAAGKTKSGSYYAMQDMNSDICNKIIVGTLGTLIDTRDNTTYAVAKYADGHCWMRQNLSLSLSNNADVVAYNFATDTTFNYRPANTTQTSTGTKWNQDASDGARSYGGNKDKYIGGTDISTAASVTTSGQPYEKIGTYYNWAAATAQTGVQTVAATDEVITSICPKGWRLPSNDSNYSFSVLMGSYGLPTINQDGSSYPGILQNPLNFNRSGYYSYAGGAVHSDLGSVGYFWSSTGFSSTSAHLFNFYSTGFHPQIYSSKGQGFSVRCVAV